MTAPGIPREPSRTEVLGRQMAAELCRLSGQGWTLAALVALLRSGWTGAPRIRLPGTITRHTGFVTSLTSREDPDATRST